MDKDYETLKKEYETLKNYLFEKTYSAQCEIFDIHIHPEVYRTFNRVLYGFYIDIICDCGLVKELDEWIMNKIKEI